MVKEKAFAFYRGSFWGDLSAIKQQRQQQHKTYNDLSLCKGRAPSTYANSSPNAPPCTAAATAWKQLQSRKASDSGMPPKSWLFSRKRNKEGTVVWASLSSEEASINNTGRNLMDGPREETVSPTGPTAPRVSQGRY